jgi:hypothetical protein
MPLPLDRRIIRRGTKMKSLWERRLMWKGLERKIIMKGLEKGGRTLERRLIWKGLER